jgi:hypothetical protein
MYGGKCGCIDKTGKVVIPLEYDNATTFSEGLAAVEKDGKQYLIDKSGKIVVALDKHYDDIGLFSDGMARVQMENRPNRVGSDYGFIDTTGKEVIPLGKYELVGWYFSEGLTEVGEFGGKFNQYGFMDKTGTVVIPMDYANVSPFDNGLAIVRPADTLLYGVIDRNCKIIIPFEYDYALPFSGNLFSARKDNKWGVIDLNGKTVIPFEYDSIGILSEGLASFNKDGKQGYMDKTGNVIISLSGNYERAMFAGEALSPFRDGFAVVYSQVRVSSSIMDMATYAKWGVIDKTGREVIPLEYDYISYFNDGLAVTFKGYTDFYHYVFSGNWGILQIVEGAVPPSTTPAFTAKPTSSTVLVNGKNVAFDAYNISGNNYFKLRDLAYILSGTGKQFEVSWDGENNAIILTSGKPYTTVGGEMTGKGAGDKTPSLTNSKIILDGKEVQFTAYNIEGNNYFKLRDIGAAFDFGVDWDGANNTIVIDTSKGYTPE